MNPISDKEFAELVKQHKTAIYSVCYMYADDEDGASDLFQECLVNIWQGLEQFKGRSSLGTWIYRVCLNTCISSTRKRRGQGSKVKLDVAADIASPSEPDGRQIAMLHQRISSLGLLDRAIVLLWLENMSYEEIGSIVGITAQNVGVRLYRIKQQLKTTNP